MVYKLNDMLAVFFPEVLRAAKHLTFLHLCLAVTTFCFVTDHQGGPRPSFVSLIAHLALKKSFCGRESVLMEGINLNPALMSDLADS